jgi:hypothetical protein
MSSSVLNDEVVAIRSLLATTAPERLLQRAAPTPSHGVEKRRCQRRIVASATRRGYAGNGQLTVFSTVLIF